MKKKESIIKSISCETVEDGSISIMARHEKKKFNLVKNSIVKIVNRDLTTETINVNTGYIAISGQKEVDLFVSEC